jgi:hypothetical protein
MLRNLFQQGLKLHFFVFFWCVKLKFQDNYFLGDLSQTFTSSLERTVK